MQEYGEKRKHKREPYSDSIEFIVLSSHEAELIRADSSGTIVDISEGGIGLTTSFPLEVGHVVEWDDKHQTGKLHIALVKWSQRLDNKYRAGLMFV